MTTKLIFLNPYDIRLPCINCGNLQTITVETNDWNAYNVQSGPHIQQIFTYLTPGQRETLISGLCESCFDRITADDEEDTDEGWACTGCGCTFTQPCPGGCYWFAEKLCSSCALKEGRIKDLEGHQATLAMLFALFPEPSCDELEDLTGPDLIDVSVNCSVCNKLLEIKVDLSDLMKLQKENLCVECSK